MMLHVVTVFHNEKNQKQALDLEEALSRYLTCEYVFTSVDNTINNRGFARACNLGAKETELPYLLFLNPDLLVLGDVSKPIIEAFTDVNTMIAGERFSKRNMEIKSWGLKYWVCGAAMGVRRTFWDEVHGFDEQYVWSWDDTDICREAQERGYRVREIPLPVHHESPNFNSEEDVNYKNHWFRQGAKRYGMKWK